MEQRITKMGKEQLTCTDYAADTTNGLTKPNVNLQCLFAIIADFKHRLCKNSRFL